MTDIETIQAEPSRDRWGRPLVIPPGGGKPAAYMRCTRFVGVLEDTFNLSLWQQRMVAVGLASRKDLALQAATLAGDPDGNKQALNKLVDAAREAAAASAAATIGTALHQLTERLDRGEPLGVVPAEYEPHMAAYRTATRGIQHQHLERFMVCDEYKVGGTPDRLSIIPGRDGLHVADVKTGDILDGKGRIRWGAMKIAMQMAMYAHSVHYDPATGERTDPGLNQKRGLVIALNAKTGDCRSVWLNLEAGWAACQVAASVWAARKADPHLEPWMPPASAEDRQLRTAQDAVLSAIQVAPDRDHILALWREAEARGVWTEEMTGAAKARIDGLAATAVATIGSEVAS